MPNQRRINPYESSAGGSSEIAPASDNIRPIVAIAVWLVLNINVAVAVYLRGPSLVVLTVTPALTLAASFCAYRWSMLSWLFAAITAFVTIDSAIFAMNWTADLGPTYLQTEWEILGWAFTCGIATILFAVLGLRSLLRLSRIMRPHNDNIAQDADTP